MLYKDFLIANKDWIDNTFNKIDNHFSVRTTVITLAAAEAFNRHIKLDGVTH